MDSKIRDNLVDLSASRLLLALKGLGLTADQSLAISRAFKETAHKLLKACEDARWNELAAGFGHAADNLATMGVPDGLCGSLAEPAETPELAKSAEPPQPNFDLGAVIRDVQANTPQGSAGLRERASQQGRNPLDGIRLRD